MTEQEKETQTPETEEETTFENQEEDTTPNDGGAEKPKESKELQSAIAQKEHFRKKYEEAQRELGKAQKTSDKIDSETKGSKKTWEAPTDPFEIVKLGKVLKDYSEDETEFILRNASSKDFEGITKAAQDPMVQAAIKATREKVASENKIPSPGNVSRESRRPSLEDIAKMSKEEHQKLWEEDLRKKDEESEVGGI